MSNTLNPNIRIIDNNRIKHSKAVEEYIHVHFNFPEQSKEWDGWVPVEYRRTGISIKTDEELVAHLNKVYAQMNPKNLPIWLKEQRMFWADKKAHTTQPFFEHLIKGGWQCVECALPRNQNWARRIQDLKELGYTIATDTHRHCPKCKTSKTHLILLPIKRGGLENYGYETFSKKLRAEIFRVLGRIDAYEDKASSHCLPDHKFPEIRWDAATKEANPDDMTEAEISKKFQLMTNQRNLQKREVCRNCYQTGERGTIFGIEFYFKGTKRWNPSFPQKGKEAEKGCEGCPWHDIARWRVELCKRINRPARTSNKSS